MAVQSDMNMGALLVLAAIMLGISLGFAIPTAISASRRGMNPIGWGALVFFTWVIGLAVYLVYMRPGSDEVKCPACGGRIPGNHVYCPFCGRKG